MDDVVTLYCLMRFRLVTPGGAVLPGGTITFQQATETPRPMGEDTEVPAIQTAVADEDGRGAILLARGTYKVRIRDADGTRYPTFNTEVPPQPEAVLALWQDEEPLPPPVVDDIRQAVRKTAEDRDAADAAAGRAEEARDEILTSSLLYVGETDIGVVMAVGQGVIVSESTSPYDSITLRIPTP